MPGGGEYEPQDSRHVVGTKGDPKEGWREQENAKKATSEYEPRDSRNVTGQPAAETERWEREGKRPPDAAGTSPSYTKKPE